MEMVRNFSNFSINFSIVGQTGVGPSDHIVRPYGINKFSDEIFQVSCGWGHTLAASSKQILSWGSNLHGQWYLFFYVIFLFLY